MQNRVNRESPIMSSAEEPFILRCYSTTSYEYSLLYVRSLPATSEAAKAAVLDVIATALRLPFTFDFDPLFKLDAVVAAKGHDLFSLLQVFLNGGLSEFKAWQQSYSGVLEKFGRCSRSFSGLFSDRWHVDLEVAQLERKIRLLTLASLGFQKVGQNVPYSKIAETLQVDASEVEKWVIDGMISSSLSFRCCPSKVICQSFVQAYFRESCRKRPNLCILCARQHGPLNGSNGKF